MYNKWHFNTKTTTKICWNKYYSLWFRMLLCQIEYEGWEKGSVTSSAKQMECNCRGFKIITFFSLDGLCVIVFEIIDPDKCT